MYTVDYFINKFKKIPAKLWCVRSYQRADKYCALGHCGARYTSDDDSEFTEESQALQDLFSSVLHFHAASVNDGDAGSFKFNSPKKRMLAALQKIKRMQHKNLTK